MLTKRIVLVEDDEALGKAIEMELKSDGFEVKWAMNGEEGEGLILKEKPDLVILDLLLPKVNGLDVLKMIRMTEEIKETPVVVLTNFDQDEWIKQGVTVGISGYYLKADLKIKDIVGIVKKFAR